MFLIIIFGFILDLLSCYRALISRFLYHFELVFLLVQGAIPYDYGDFTLEIISVYTILLFVVFSSKEAGRITANILLTMICLTIVFHLEIPLLSTEKWKTNKFILYSGALVLNFIALTCVSMISTNRRKRFTQIKDVIVDNLSLIDKMHEGLIVLSEPDLNLVFANIPAVTLLQ